MGRFTWTFTFTRHVTHDINTTSTGIKWEDRFTRHLQDIYMTLTPHQLVVNWNQMGRFT